MNTKYLSYLFKNRKVAIIFFFILYLAICLTPYISGNTYANINDSSYINSLFGVILGIGFAMSVMLTYILPVILFSFVHSKKSVDLYFALPVKRKDQLITNILFAFVIAFGYFLISSLIGFIILGLKHISIIGYLIILLYVAAFLLAMICINSLLFIVANNSFDGIVMIASYTGLALIVYFALWNYMSTMIAGYGGALDADLAIYISPLSMGISTFSTLLNKYINNSEYNRIINILYLIIPFILGAVACYGLYRHFVLRKTERAEQVSNEFFAYPFVIHFYALLCLLILSFEAVQSGFLNVFIFYLIILFIYIVATFVYRRKISVKPIYLIFFALATILTLLFSSLSWKTKAFGMAENYRLDESKNLVYEAYYYGEELFGEETHVSINVKIPTSNLKEYQEVIDIFEAKRHQAIEEYYANEEKESKYYYSQLYVSHLDNRNRTDKNYSYTLNDTYTIDELKIIDKYGDVEIDDYSDGELYTLEEYLKKKGN